MVSKKFINKRMKYHQALEKTIRRNDVKIGRIKNEKK